MNMLFEKFKEVLFSVLPLTLIVVILSFTVVHIEAHIMLRFLVGSVLIIMGLTTFLFGVDLGIAPIGNLLGSTITKSNKIWIVIFSGLVLGFFITIAEPDLHILSEQIAMISSGIMGKTEVLIAVAVGVALLLTLGFIRVIYNKSLPIILTALYGIIFLISLFVSPEVLAISFDSSGATTGAMTVPFILTLGIGISSLKKGKSSEEDSFGLVAVASTGAILGMMFLNFFTGSVPITGNLETSINESTAIFLPFIEKIPSILGEIILALLPILIIFIFFQFISFKLKKKPFKRILKGLFYTMLGLVLFLTGVNAGFMDVGRLVGYNIAETHHNALLIGVGALFGLVIVLAEPAVHVLTRQIEDVTSGYIRRSAVLVTLAIGVALAVILIMVKIIFPFVELWHFLLPGYIIALGLGFFIPKLFVGMSFDSGGIASGPMTITFLLAFAQGAASSIADDGLLGGFGVIALVALMPIITLQILGLIFKIKSIKEGVSKNG